MKNYRKQISRFYPAHHPKAGQSTYFVEKIWNALMRRDNDVDFLPTYYEICNLNEASIKNPDTLLTATDVDTFWYGDKGVGGILVNYMNAVGQKPHTIRQCNISKKTGLQLRVEVGDTVQFFVWSGKLYKTAQITVTPPIPVVKVWDFELTANGFLLHGEEMTAEDVNRLARNDGLSRLDMMHWFQYPKLTGPMQIICWSDSITY
jgi:hypothetical protein